LQSFLSLDFIGTLKIVSVFQFPRFPFHPNKDWAIANLSHTNVHLNSAKVIDSSDALKAYFAAGIVSANKN